MPLVSIRQLSVDGSEFLQLAPSMSYVLDSPVSEDPTSLIARDVDGKRWSIPIIKIQSFNPKYYLARFSDFTPITERAALGLNSAELERVKKAQTNSPFNSLGSVEKAEFLTKIQLKTSTHAAAVVDAYSRGIRDANRLLMRLLDSGDKLTIKHLEQLNSNVNAGRLVLGMPVASSLVGVLRGTSKVVKINGQKTFVDNFDFQIHQGFTVEGDYFAVNSFPPAMEVPMRVEGLLKKINSLSSNSSLVTVFDLYREIIMIHPYVDGNGRTGRVVLNFMLLKTGFPPIPVASESLYFTSLELAHRYIETIRNNGT